VCQLDGSLEPATGGQTLPDGLTHNEELMQPEFSRRLRRCARIDGERGVVHRFRVVEEMIPVGPCPECR
jgi:hypothetical protein